MKRPLSINDYDEERETITLIYQMKGQGTRAFSLCLARRNDGRHCPDRTRVSSAASDKKVFLVGGAAWALRRCPPS